MTEKMKMAPEVIDSNVQGVRPATVDATVGGLIAEVPIPFERFGWLSVRVEIEVDSTVVMVESVTGQYGIGGTFQEALSHLDAELAEYVDYLSSRGPERLSARLAGHLQHLAGNPSPQVQLPQVPSGNNRQLSVAA